MTTVFDIFKRLPDGMPLWIESVKGLSEAEECLSRLASNAPGEYFIYSEKTGGIVEQTDKPQCKQVGECQSAVS